MRNGKRQMIRLLAVILAGGLFMTACGRNEAAPETSSSVSEEPAQEQVITTPRPTETPAAETEAEETQAAEETAASSAEEEETEENPVKALELERVNNDIGEVTGDLYIYEFQETYQVKGNNAVVQDGLGRVNQRMRELTLSYLDDYEIVAENAWIEADGDIDLNLRAGMEVDLVRADTRVISYTNRLVQSGLPEHDRTAVVGANIDPVTGRELALEEVVKDMDTFARAVKDQLRKDLAEDPQVNDATARVDALLARGNGISDAELSWTLNYGGITMHFNNGYGFPYGTETGKTRTVYIRASEYKDVYDAHYLARPDSVTTMDTED